MGVLERSNLNLERSAVRTISDVGSAVSVQFVLCERTRGEERTHFKLRELEPTEIESEPLSPKTPTEDMDEGNVHARMASADECHQVRIDARDTRLIDRGRERLQPPLGIPLHRVFTPDRLAGIARTDAAHDRRALGNHELLNHFPV